MSERSSAVRVVVRLRPMNEEEKQTGVTPVISASEEHKTVSVMKGEDMSRTIYSFNNVFSAFTTQKEVFDGTLSPMIDDVLHGFESTVFAYGQTGTGKTHTMEGDLSDPIKFGVIPRSSDAIFGALRNGKFESFRVTVSYLEIYNEDLCDLLTEPTSSTKLEIMNKKSGTFCRGLTEVQVSSSDDVLKLMNKALQSKKIGETKMNKHSSRSHCIFTINVHTIVAKGDSTTQHLGKLHMVDLAGSENAKTAGIGSRQSATGSARERERLNINRSLLTLGRVIAAVKDSASGKKNIRIPYRDSKLTRILQEALGGRSKTLIIATVSPAQSALSESISTLNYAQSANGITNKPKSASYNSMASKSNSPFVDPTGAVEQWFELECKLKYMEAQIEEAKVALSRKEQQQQRTNDRAEKAEHALTEMEWKNEELNNRVTSLQDHLENETERGNSLSTQLQQTEDALKQTSSTLKETEESYEKSQQTVAELEGLLDKQTKKSDSLTTQLKDTSQTLTETCSVLKKTEENLQSSEEKATRLEDHLDKSTKKCESLTSTLRKTEDTLQKTARVLKSTQSKLESSKQKAAQLDDSLKKETEKCESLTSQLQKTEDTLLKTTEILQATKKTEENLTSEAQMLIEAMKKSVNDGDALYNRLLEARDADFQRRNATKSFNEVTVNVLDNITSKINAMTDGGGKFREKIKENSRQTHAKDKEAIEESLAAMQDINNHVKSLTTAIKASSLNGDGVLPTFSNLTQTFRQGLTEVKSSIERGEKLSSKSMTKSCEKIQQYAQELSSLDKIFVDASETLQSEISMSGNETRDQVVKMTSLVKDSITAVSNANSEIRKDLSDILKELHQESIKVTKHAGRQALKQHSRFSKAIETFEEKMKINNNLQQELGEELEYVNANGSSTLEDLSSQSVMLTMQKQAYADAIEKQKKMRAEMMTTVMEGIQQLLTSEMARITEENATQFKAFDTDTDKITELNANIQSSTRNIVSHVEDRNKSAVEYANELHKNNQDFYAISEETDNTLVEIKEIMRKHHGFLSEGAKQTNEKMSSLEDLDEPIQNTIEKLDADKEGIEGYIADSVIVAFTEGVQNMSELEANKMEFLSEKIIPDATSALQELSAEQNKVHADLTAKVESIQNDADNGHTQVQDLITNQCSEVDELQNSVNNKCIDYDETVAGKRRREIESSHAIMLEEIESYYEITTGQFSEAKNLVTQVDGNIDSFAKDIIHTDEEVPEVEPRHMIPFSEKLSSTLSDDKIISTIGKFSSKPADIEVVTPCSPVMMMTTVRVPSSSSIGDEELTTSSSPQIMKHQKAIPGTPSTVSIFTDDAENESPREEDREDGQFIENGNIFEVREE